MSVGARKDRWGGGGGGTTSAYYFEQNVSCAEDPVKYFYSCFTFNRH